MRFSILACLALCLAVAVATPVGKIGVITQIGTGVNSQSVLIDVTSDFVDDQQNEHIFEVAVGVTVQAGAVLLNGQRIGTGVQSTVQFAALFREVDHASKKIVNAHNVKVGLQALVQASVSATGLQALNVQLLLSEVDGNLLHQVNVHEVVIFLSASGAEKARQSRTMGVANSAITTTAAPVAHGDSSDSSDSPAEVESHFRHHMEKCHVRRFFNWLHKQSFGVRVLVFAAMTLIALLAIRILFCLVTLCCCRRPKTRTTYLDNVKLHYVPLSMDDTIDEKKLLHI